MAEGGDSDSDEAMEGGEDKDDGDMEVDLDQLSALLSGQTLYNPTIFTHHNDRCNPVILLTITNGLSPCRTTLEEVDLEALQMAQDRMNGTHFVMNLLDPTNPIKPCELRNPY
jgi:hypothetical protein